MPFCSSSLTATGLPSGHNPRKGLLDGRLHLAPAPQSWCRGHRGNSAGLWVLGLPNVASDDGKSESSGSHPVYIINRSSVKSPIKSSLLTHGIIPKKKQNIIHKSSMKMKATCFLNSAQPPMEALRSLGPTKRASTPSTWAMAWNWISNDNY